MPHIHAKPSDFYKYSYVSPNNVFTYMIVALGEVEAGRSRGQEIKTILVNMVKLRLY